MVVRDRSFSRESPVCDYWLSRCEGFVVRAGGRTVGVVETVAASDSLGRAEELLVRRRRRGVVISAEQVLAVVPGRREVLARRKAGRLRPWVRTAYATVKPLAAAVARLAWALALRLVRDGVVLVRAAGDQIRDYKRQRDLERDQQAEQRQQNDQSFSERLLDAGRRWRGEAPRPHLEQGMAELARRLRRLDQLSRRLPRGRNPRRSTADRAPHDVRRAELEDARAAANGYVFALGHDRLDVGREHQRAAAVDQP